MSFQDELNIDNVVVEDANEMARELLANAPKEVPPEGKVFDGITCIDCGDPIEEDRLRLVPTCRCSECKGYYDKEQRVKALNGAGNAALYEDE